MSSLRKKKKLFSHLLTRVYSASAVTGALHQVGLLCLVRTPQINDRSLGGMASVLRLSFSLSKTMLMCSPSSG